MERDASRTAWTAGRALLVELAAVVGDERRQRLLLRQAGLLDNRLFLAVAFRPAKFSDTHSRTVIVSPRCSRRWTVAPSSARKPSLSYQAPGEAFRADQRRSIQSGSVAAYFRFSPPGQRISSDKWGLANAKQSAKRKICTLPSASSMHGS